jgi:hypothetical protein
VPSYGVLTNGLTYAFYKYEADSKTLSCTYLDRMFLRQGTSASDAQREAEPVLGILTGVIQQQKDALNAAADSAVKLCMSVSSLQ